MPNELTIYYNGGLNEKLDDGIKKYIKKFGYDLKASGYAFEDDVRDLVFEKALWANPKPKKGKKK